MIKTEGALVQTSEACPLLRAPPELLVGRRADEDEHGADVRLRRLLGRVQGEVQGEAEAAKGAEK